MEYSTPAVIDFLKTHSLSDLEKLHGVKHRFSDDRTKFCLNYSQFDAKSRDKISECCRGLVLRPTEEIKSTDIVGDCEVLSWPMHRFYNHDDPAAAPIDWNSAYALEKLDGTMCSVYFDELKDRWCVATRAVAEADVPLNESKNTFAMLFKRAVHNMLQLSDKITHECAFVETFCRHLNPRHTYVFELTTPWNSIVIKHTKPRVHLLAVRDKRTGQEFSLLNTKETLVTQLGVPTPQHYAFDDLSKMIEFVESRSAEEAEGVVIVDQHMNRVKIKSLAYNLANRILDLTPRMALEAFIAGKLGDLIKNADRDTAEDLRKLESDVLAFLARTDAAIARFKSEALNRKHFAELVNLSNEWASACFACWEKHASTLVWLQHLHATARLTPSLLDVLNQHK